MMKVVKARKASKFRTALAIAAMVAYLANPFVAHAAEVGDVLYVETEDTYVQEEIVDVQDEVTIDDSAEVEYTEGTQEEVVQEDTVQEDTVQESVIPDDVETEVESAYENTNEPQVGDVLYEEEGRREFGEDEFIDADNWSPELDIDPDAGDYIPDYIEDEVDIKLDGEEPDETPDRPDRPDRPDDRPDRPDDRPDRPDDTPDNTPDDTPDNTPDDTPDNTPDDTPEDVPKLGEEVNYAKYFGVGSALAGLTGLAQLIFAHIKKAKNNISNINGMSKVVDAKKKYVNNNKVKKLK